MRQAAYTVDFIDGAWKIGVNGKTFGPYSTRETAMAAAVKAARKAEEQGYEVLLKVLGEGAPADEADRNAA